MAGTRPAMTSKQRHATGKKWCTPSPFLPAYTKTTGLTGAPVAPRILMASRIRQAA
jgi:hypothetical protein